MGVTRGNRQPRHLAGWGRHPVVRGIERLDEDLRTATQGAALSRGLGRSYGDASLPPSESRPVAGTRLGDRLLSFDADRGLLRAEAGLCLRRLNEIFPRRGFATPVTPGTQYVTLGGCVASDVHGKNHHVAGTFGRHVRELRIRVADGRILDISPEHEPELFDATLGGMGLTGHLLEVEVGLEPTHSLWIWEEKRRVADLDTLVRDLREASSRWPFTMAWADTTARGRALGRGILIVGRYATPEEAPTEPAEMTERLAVPMDLPSGALSTWSIRIFNSLWYRLRGTRHTGIVHPQPFFYPLDGIRDWNRLYGKRGFTQYQCVLPLSGDGRAHQRFFETLHRLGGASPVSVIKDCGPEGRGTLSFPKPGISIALDLPYRGPKTQALIDALNEIVIADGGRIYATKDALTRPEHFAAMEPRLPAFQAIRRQWDPECRLASALSVRLLGDEPT